MLPSCKVWRLTFRLSDQTKQRIYDLWMRCHTQQEIAEVVGEDLRTVERKTADFRQNGQVSDLSIFRNFEPEIYTVWNFGKARQPLRVKLQVLCKLDKSLNCIISAIVTVGFDTTLI